MILLYYVLFMSILMLLAIPMWKMDTKVGMQNPYWKYCIPIYNIILLCKQAGISPLVLIATLLLSIGMSLMGYSSGVFRFCLTYIFFGYLSYKLAKTFRRNAMIWSIVGGLCFPLALVRFAFGRERKSTR